MSGLVLTRQARMAALIVAVALLALAAACSTSTLVNATADSDGGSADSAASADSTQAAATGSDRDAPVAEGLNEAEAHTSDPGHLAAQTPEPNAAPSNADESTAVSTSPAVEPTAAPDSTSGSTPTAEPTAAPAPTSQPTSTSAAQPTATPAPTSQPTSTPTAEPTATPESTATPAPTATGVPDHEKTQPPTDYDGPIRALRTAGGAMLTVRSAGPPWEVVTPCYNLASVTDGLPLTRPIDVLIDPGHGGDETGAVAPNGLIEAHINLDVADRLRLILREAGYGVAMTRYSDHRMAIQARTELANALQPRIFISIHHNGGYPEPVDQPGTEVFVQHGDDRSRRLGGILFEEMQAEFADVDIAWVGTEYLGVSWRLNEHGTDLYGVLRRTEGVVSVLTEAMYMTTEPEAEFLATDEAIEKEAQALARGIDRYLTSDDPGSGYIEGLLFRGTLGTGGGTDGCVDPDFD